VTIRLTDYIDVRGDLRTHYGPPQMARRKIGELIGRRIVSGERYEDIGGCRTWSEAREAYDIEVPTTQVQ